VCRTEPPEKVLSGPEGADVAVLTQLALVSDCGSFLKELL
jgi:hypothetical protein